MEQKTVEDIQKEVDAVLGENKSLKDALAAAKGELESKGQIEAKAVELETKISDLEGQIAEKTQKVEDLQAKLSAPTIVRSKEEQLRARVDEIKSFFGHYVTGGVPGLQKAFDEMETKAADLQISTDAQGGYALPEELRREIIRLEHEQSPLRQVVSVTSASTTDVKQLVSVGSAASGWVGETDARAQTNSPEVAQRTAVFGEIYAKPKAYQHVLEDAFFNVVDWLLGEVAREFAEKEGVAFLSGDGTNKPVGILNGLTLSASTAGNDVTGVYQVIKSATDGALGANDAAVVDFLRTIPLAMKTGYLGNARWMMNRATHNVLVNLKNSDGEYFLQRELVNAAAERLFGYPIIINEDMASIPATTNTGAAVILFGDFARAYQVIDRVGVSMLRDPYTAPGSVNFYTRKRVGSMKLDVSALKVVSVSKV